VCNQRYARLDENGKRAKVRRGRVKVYMIPENCRDCRMCAISPTSDRDLICPLNGSMILPAGIHRGGKPIWCEIEFIRIQMKKKKERD
jgi:hypothetical protein